MEWKLANGSKVVGEGLDIDEAEVESIFKMREPFCSYDDLQPPPEDEDELLGR